VNYGLLTDARGCPVAIGVHQGNVADSTTLLPTVTRLREAFGVERLVLVGDRGMIAQQAIATLAQADRVHWITALKSGSIRSLIEEGQLQLGSFDERNLFEFALADYPRERLVACRNDELAKLRGRKRCSCERRRNGDSCRGGRERPSDRRIAPWAPRIRPCSMERSV
jgi:hypothetical protein